MILLQNKTAGNAMMTERRRDVIFSDKRLNDGRTQFLFIFFFSRIDQYSRVRYATAPQCGSRRVVSSIIQKKRSVSQEPWYTGARVRFSFSVKS